MMLRGDRVVLRPVAEPEVLDRIVREPAVAKWWSPPDGYEGMLAVVFEDEVVGAVQVTEEADPDFRHAGIDIFLTRVSTVGVWGPTPCAPWRGGWSASAATTG